MKTQFTFICLVLLSASLLGQNGSNASLFLNADHQKTKSLQEQALREVLLLNRIQNQSQWNLGEIKQRLDSIIWETTYEADQLVPYSKTGYNYNNYGQTTSSIDFNWEETSENWKQTRHTVFTFDEDGYLIESLQTANFIDGWVNFSQRKYDYDAHGNIILSETYDWDNEVSVWVGNVKTEFEYGPNDEVDNYVFYFFNDISGQWDANSKGKYTYNENDLLTEFLESFWQPYDSIWHETNREEMQYDANRNLVQKNIFFHPLETEDWRNAEKEEYAYDTEGNLIYDLKSKWVDSTGMWINEDQTDYEYDQNGNNIFYTTSIWDTVLGDWKFDTRFNGNYNLNYDKDELLLPSSIKGGWKVFNGHIMDFVNMPVEILYQDFQDGNWVDDRKWSYFYSEQDIADVENHHNENVNIYPNPAIDMISIVGLENSSLITFRLFDGLGKVVLVEKRKGGNKIQLGELRSGVYFYRIEAESKIYHGKILVE